MVKYTKQHLLNNEYVWKVSEDGANVTCICGNKIKWKCPYDEDYINQHVESGGCKRKRTPKKLLNFFKLMHKISYQ